MEKGINLVLSGGGARGFAHIGVIKALIEEGVSIRKISGVSSGAAVGAFFCRNISPDEIYSIFEENKILRLVRPSLKKGLLKMSRATAVLRKYFPRDSFSELSIPLFVCATNIRSGYSEYFSEGMLIKPLLASSAIPFLFSPVKINGEEYLDGGILNNLPVEPLEGDDHPVVAVHVNPVNREKILPGAFTVLRRTMELGVHQNVLRRKSGCDIFLEPPDLKNYTVFDTEKSKAIMKAGYEYGKREAAKILSLTSVIA